MKNIVLLTFILLLTITVHAQVKRVLFLGNSYTNVNNLPNLVQLVADSAGDTLITDSNTPGGYTLQGHSTNITSLNKIAQGNWDFVVLQEQSQRPSFPLNQVIDDVFPYATILDSMINASSPCGETMFYMTWGRKNGDASNCANWPPVCTYEGMDSLLNLRYRMMADSNDAVLSPVGAVWNYIRSNYPTIDLYAADGSHPSQAGSYAAACTFYSSIFRKDPTLITYDYTLDTTSADLIKSSVKTVVFDSLLKWHIGEYDVVSDFSYINTSVVDYQFTNLSQNADSSYWNINGVIDTAQNPSYTFPGPGSYNVSLIAFTACDTLIHSDSIVIMSTAINELSHNKQPTIYPNPATDILYITSYKTPITSAIIFDLKGNKLYEPKILSDQIDISKLDQGVYIIEFQFNSFNLHQKFIKISEK